MICWAFYIKKNQQIGNNFTKHIFVCMSIYDTLCTQSDPSGTRRNPSDSQLSASMRKVFHRFASSRNKK